MAKSEGARFWEATCLCMLGALPHGAMLVRLEGEAGRERLRVVSARGAALGLIADGVEDPAALELAEALGPRGTHLDLEACRRAAASPEPSSLGQAALLDDLGRERVFEVRASAAPGSGVLLHLEDITARRERESTEQDALFLREVIDNIPDMIFVKDASELRFLRFNKAGESLLGFERSELIGRNDYDFFPKEEADFFTEKDREVLRSGALLEIPNEPIHTRHHGVRRLNTKKIPILDAKGEPLYLLGISRDVTEMLHTARELERSNADLEQFATVASHDLQEPLRKIAVFASLIEERYASGLDPRGQEMLGRVIGAAERMKAMVQDLLVLSRAMRPEGEREVVDLAAICQEVLIDLHLALREASVKVTIDPLPEVEGYSRQFQQLLQNLVSNAIKFRRRGVQATLRISEASADDPALGDPLPKGFCRVVVEDNGIGLGAADAERIFKPFERLHGRNQYPGSGMGLAICQRIVVGHGGRISARPIEPHGLQILIDLPLGGPPDDL